MCKKASFEIPSFLFFTLFQSKCRYHKFGSGLLSIYTQVGFLPRPWNQINSRYLYMYNCNVSRYLCMYNCIFSRYSCMHYVISQTIDVVYIIHIFMAIVRFKDKSGKKAKGGIKMAEKCLIINAYDDKLDGLVFNLMLNYFICTQPTFWRTYHEICLFSFTSNEACLVSSCAHIKNRL